MGGNLPQRELALDLFTTLARIYACDEVLRNAIKTGKANLFYFPIAGHEAIAAAMSQALRRDDNLSVTYRGLHHQLAKGVPFRSILGEMLGKETAIAKGKGRVMHVCDPDVGMMVTSGIVGSTLPAAVGLALASKVRGDGKVTMCFHGDGAINTGAFHEGMNLASVWKLPLVIVCENNLYAEATPTHHTYCGTIEGRVRAYDIPVSKVDGFDPLATCEAMMAAVERARAGDGPTFIEARCFRFLGHFMGDPMAAVPPEQLEAEKAKDAMPNFRAKLIEIGILDEEEADAIRKEAAEEAQQALADVLAAPALDGSVLADGVYAEPVAVR